MPKRASFSIATSIWRDIADDSVSDFWKNLIERISSILNIKSGEIVFNPPLVWKNLVAQDRFNPSFFASSAWLIFFSLIPCVTRARTLFVIFIGEPKYNKLQSNATFLLRRLRSSATSCVSMKLTKRTTIDVSPSMKARIRKVAKKTGLGVTIVTDVILESAMPDFESGKSKVVATVADREGGQP